MNSQERQELLGLVTAMPEGMVREVLAFAREALAKAKIDISYDWTDEDLEDLRRSSADYANRALPWEDVPPADDGTTPR